MVNLACENAWVWCLSPSLEEGLGMVFYYLFSFLIFIVIFKIPLFSWVVFGNVCLLRKISSSKFSHLFGINVICNIFLLFYNYNCDHFHLGKKTTKSPGYDLGKEEWVFQTEGTASAKAKRRECAWCTLRTARRSTSWGTGRVEGESCSFGLTGPCSSFQKSSGRWEAIRGIWAVLIYLPDLC